MLPFPQETEECHWEKQPCFPSKFTQKRRTLVNIYINYKHALYIRCAQDRIFKIESFYLIPYFSTVPVKKISEISFWVSFLSTCKVFICYKGPIIY